MEYLVQPWAHQKAAIEKARKLSSFALFFEQGTGKTSTLINILREKWRDDSRPFRTLILCPPIVISNWKREILKYSKVPQDKVIELTGSGFMRLCKTDSPQDAIYVTNYQSLLMDKLFKRFIEMRFNTIVLDESHKIKTYNSKTTKAVLKLGESASYRYCLTGTPILDGKAFDLWPQVFFLDRGEILGKSFFKFREEFFHDFNAGMPRHTYFPNWKIKPDSLPKLHAAIQPISARAEKSECLDLPPLVRERIDCELTDEQADVYRDLEKQFVAELGTKQVITDLELTKDLRLQQIVTGHVPTDDGKVHSFEPNPRIAALREVLEGIGGRHKVLIWAVFRENFRVIEALLSALAIPFVSVYGGVGSAEQRKRCDHFETSGSCRVLVGHPRSCGIGVNLTAASYAVYFSRGFSLEDDLQSEARNYRGGSERHTSVTRIDLVTPGTIDEVILEALESKQSLADAIIKHVQKKKENPCYRQLPNTIKVKH
jgi:SNF2 family DNA or RNA helicase